MTAFVEITMRDNAALVWPHQFVRSRSPVDLTGATFAAAIKINAADSAPVLELTSENGGLIAADAETGRLLLTIDAGALPVGDYVFDALYTRESIPLLLYAGTITVEKGIT